VRLALVLVLCAGCSQVFGLDKPILRPDAGGDGRLDDVGDGSQGFCYGSSLVRVCFAAEPTGNVSPSGTIDTDAPGSCATVLNTNAWCVIAGSSVAFPSATKFHGSRPLVVVATDAIMANSMLDVASHRGSQVGPGADAAGCGAGGTPGPQEGGPGGSFGGTGGPGNNGAVVAGAALVINSYRGGCPGGDGAGSSGSGGLGGGAVYMIAGTTINIGPSGAIDASGSGGGGGIATDNGAGGGGSGGFVGLEAPAVTVAGVVFANGGGGGEGADQNNGNAGSEPASPDTAAVGGDNATQKGGPGGVGSFGSTKNGGAGAVGTTPAGGGGGGGGAGVLWVPAAPITGTGKVAPPPS
jgi:hypothetical protein